jgi:hypothetical protein
MSIVEQTIVSKIILLALEKAYTVSVFDGMAWALKRSTDFEAITAEVNATDLTELIFHSAADQSRIGGVTLIHGNDEDVIHDYSDNPRTTELCS